MASNTSNSAVDVYAGGHVSLNLTEETDVLTIFLHRYDREHTRRSYYSDITQFFGAHIIPVSLVKQVTFLHVNMHIEKMQREDKKASTIKRRIAAIRMFYEWLLALGVVDKNPANKQLLRTSRTTSSRTAVLIALNAEQAKALLSASLHEGKAAIRDHALVTILLHCVLRRSEAAAMDVDHIRPLGSYWILDIPKAKGGADQYVKVPEHVVELIDAMKSHYKISSGPLWRSLSNNGFGNRLSTHAIYMIVKKAAERAGLPNIGAHSLRHTGCTLAIESGASLQQVQQHARHKNIETTMAYVHQRDRLKNSAADFIDLK